MTNKGMQKRIWMRGVRVQCTDLNLCKHENK